MTPEHEQFLKEFREYARVYWSLCHVEEFTDTSYPYAGSMTDELQFYWAGNKDETWWLLLCEIKRRSWGWRLSNGTTTSYHRPLDGYWLIREPRKAHDSYKVAWPRWEVALRALLGRFERVRVTSATTA